MYTVLDSCIISTRAAARFRAEPAPRIKLVHTYAKVIYLERNVNCGCPANELQLS